VLPFIVLDVREYLDESGRSPFGTWFRTLNAIAAAKVVTAIARIGQGNLSNAKSVGAGVLEFRIDFGPGYRLYFGRDGNVLVILLAGGTKKRQQHDIEIAKIRWADYGRRRPPRR
jgi:putative addiction module killer protein